VPRGDGPNRGDMTKPVPFSHRYLYSDSDDEGSYTVTDHDIRLAYVLVALFSRHALKLRRNLRPPSALPLRHADDESMSSGDESDDMDLTEGSSCGSDMSEWNEGTRSHSTVSLSTHLAYLLKMTPRQRNIFLPSVIPRCPGTMAFRQRNLPLGLIPRSLPFGYSSISLIPDTITYLHR
jgi:hypothetical protein